jgi:predicted RNase H-like nuclease (RuvC/YqgF family)
VSIILSLSDKLTLLHDYLKVSLHLLEIKLSNKLESSSRSPSPSSSTSPNQNANANTSTHPNHETDEATNARFELTMESLQEIEKEMKQNLSIFKKEVQHQDIKIAAKDNVIENLLKTDERLKENVKKLQSEIDVFKSLSNYSSVNVGVMTRFQECHKLEQELEEKELEIKRLNGIISVHSTKGSSGD